LHTTEARKPAAKANRIPLSNPNTVLSKYPNVIPPISSGSASMGKMAIRPYTEASAEEQSFPPMISALFRLVRNNKPRVPSRLSTLMQSAVRAVPRKRLYRSVKTERTLKISGAARRLLKPLKAHNIQTSNPKKSAAVSQRVR
jgi:hypothetical protein